MTIKHILPRSASSFVEIYINNLLAKHLQGDVHGLDTSGCLDNNEGFIQVLKLMVTVRITSISPNTHEPLKMASILKW